MRLTTTTLGPLGPHLIDLAAAFEAQGLSLMLVGGFGLVLRRQWRQAEGATTLIDAVPAARATEDFDVLLRLEMLENPAQRQASRTVLADLEYKVLKANLHFVKPGTGGDGRRDVKVDFLAPLSGADSPGLKTTKTRVGARSSTEDDSLHGYPTAEADLLAGDIIRVPLEGMGTDGIQREGHVELPHPFMLILMKLRAFRDEFEGRKSDDEPRLDFAAKHLADVYTLVALLTQQEAAELPEMARQQQTHPVVLDARGIVHRLLSGENSEGTLLLREQRQLSIAPDDLQTFLGMLADTFA